MFVDDIQARQDVSQPCVVVVVMVHVVVLYRLWCTGHHGYICLCNITTIAGLLFISDVTRMR